MAANPVGAILIGTILRISSAHPSFVRCLLYGNKQNKIDIWPSRPDTAVMLNTGNHGARNRRSEAMAMCMPWGPVRVSGVRRVR